PGVVVTARRDVAGLPMPVPFEKGFSYEVAVQSKHLSGPQARLVVVANGSITVMQADLPLDGSWRTTRFRFVNQADAHDLYLYLYVTGLDTGAGSAEAISDVSLIMQPLFPDVVIDANPSATVCGGANRCQGGQLHWAVELRGSDPAWSVDGSVMKMSFAA